MTERATAELPERPRLAFVGAGRVAGALARGFARSGYPVVAVASRNAASAGALAAAVPGCHAVRAPQEAVDRADLVLLTVPDDAIGPVVTAAAWRAGVGVVHASGAAEVDVLAPAARQGALIGGFHPLQNFADPEVALAGLPGCVVAIEAQEPLGARLEALAQALGMRPIRLPAGARALYHGAGSFAAPFITALLHEAVRIWKGFGMSEADALAALVPLARGTLDAVARDGTVRGLAGPVARGDTGTVARHVAAFGALDERTLAFYREMAERVIPIALEKGGLAPERAEEIRALLRTSRALPGT
ncbi:MAG TPA: DUF2520 domain-containing protein [Burkholderiales bacterium]|nr:DUF2520 domain-containing protein [Burkholderiales bacterium]